MSPSPGDSDNTDLPRSDESFRTTPSRSSRPTTPHNATTNNTAAPPSTPPPTAPSPVGCSSASPSPSPSPSNVNPNSVKAAMSFVKRINAAAGSRKPAPLNVPPGPSSETETGPGGLPSISSAQTTPGPEGPLVHNHHSHPVVTESEVIEAAAPGSTIGGPLLDDQLDQIVAPPSLERSVVSDYAAAAENWLMTDKMLIQHEEFVSRGLLMLRNIIRSDPRFAAQASASWLPLIKDFLDSRYGLIRASAANCLAAFAANTPGRDAIQKDSLVIQRTLQMLTTGISSGCDNMDTQYSSMALANIAMNYSCKGPLLRHGMLPLAADVLRAAVRWLEAGGGGGGGGGASDKGGRYGGRGSAAILKAATFMTTLLTCWAVDAVGREQLQQHGIHSLASELHGRVAGVLGDDFPLSRRLALLAEATAAIELLDDILEQEVAGGPAWDLWIEEPDPQQQPRISAQGASLRGVSFVAGPSKGGTTMNRTLAAMESLYRVTAEGTAPGGQGAAGGALSSHVSMVARNMSRKQSVSGNFAAAAPAGSPTISGPLPSPLGGAMSPGSAGGLPDLLPGSATPRSPLASPRDMPALGTRSSRALAVRASHPGVMTGSHSHPQVPLSPTQPGVAPHGHSHLSLSAINPLPAAAAGGGGAPASRDALAGTLASSVSVPTLLGQSRHSHFADGVLGTSGSLSSLQGGLNHGSGAVAHGAHGGTHGSLHGPAGHPGSPGAGGSMNGVHFAANIFHEAAAARGLGSDDDGPGALRRRSVSTNLSPHQTAPPPSKPVRFPPVGKQSFASLDGGLAPPPGARSSVTSPMPGRVSESPGGPHGGRLDLPFHLVRPIPTISAASGKVSRISAAYGQMASHQPHPGSSGSLTPQSSYPSRIYTSDV